MKKIHAYLAFGIVPLVNIVAATRLNLINKNLSDLSSIQEYYWLYLAWSICSVTSFFMGYLPLLNYIKKSKGFYCILSIISISLFILATFIPYELVDKPILAVMHINITILATVFYICLVYLTIRPLWFKNHNCIRQFAKQFTILIIICLGIYAFFGSINSLSEIIFCITTGILLYHLQYQLNKNN